MKSISTKPLVLWFLNHDWDPKELAFQMDEMARQNVGGFFMHWLTGGEPYMAERWLEQLDFIVRQAATRSLEAWLYDEAWCPSCFAGGRILAEQPELQLQTIHCDHRDATGGEEIMLDFELMTILGIVAMPLRAGRPDPASAVRLDGHAGPVRTGLQRPYRHRNGYYAHVDPMEHWRAGSDGYAWRLKWKAPATSDWRVYVFCARRALDFDGLNRLDVLAPESAEAFLAETHDVYADRFHSHFGTTIPGVMMDEPKFSHMPWTPRLPDLFERRFGENFVDSLPAIFDPSVPDGRRARVNYHRLVSDLFNRNYIRPVAEWCREHNLVLTGHISPEEDLSHETVFTGSIHRHLEHFDIPGTDLIIETVGDRRRPALNLAPKLAASVAHQQGRERAFTEVGGVCEETLGLERLKTLVDWHFVHGINLITLHGLAYSTEGRLKFLAGQVLSVRNNLWPHFDELADHIDRSCRFLLRYPRNPRAAMLKPHTASRALTAPLDPAVQDTRERIDESLIRTAWALLSAHVDFDLLDEDTAEDWRGDDGGLRVGAARYELVVVPECDWVSAACADHLSAFAAGGGTLVTVGATPGVLRPGGEDSWSLSHEQRLRDTSGLAELATATVGHDFRLKAENDGDILLHHGRNGAGEPGFFLLNTGDNDTTVELTCGTRTWTRALAPGQSAAASPANADSGTPATVTPPRPSLELDGHWHVAASGPNHLPLTAPRTVLKMDEGAAIHRLVCDESDWQAVRDSLTINGKRPDWSAISNTAFYDFRNKQIPVAPHFTVGENVVELDVEEFPTVLLLGEFSAFIHAEDAYSVRLPTERTDDPIRRIACGFPWLKGVLQCTKEFTVDDTFAQGARLRLPGRCGSIAVSVDDLPVGTVAWKPDVLDIGPLRPGPHQLRLDIVGDGLGLLRGEPIEAGLSAAPIIASS